MEVSHAVSIEFNFKYQSRLRSIQTESNSSFYKIQKPIEP